MKMRMLLLFFIYALGNLGNRNISWAAEEDEWAIKFDPQSKSLQPTFLAITLRVSGGQVSVIRNADKLAEKVLPETKFKLGDMIETGEGGYLKIKMIDSTLIDIGPKARFQLKDYGYKSQKERTSVYELLEGKVRTWFRLSAGPEDIKIKAGGVAMGIRGTEVMLNMSTPLVAGAPADPVTDILLLSGEVQVETTKKVNKENNDKDQVKPYDLTPGTIFESDHYAGVLAGKDSFQKVSEADLLAYQGVGINKEQDLLPFLEVPKRQSLPAVDGAAPSSSSQESTSSSSSSLKTAQNSSSNAAEGQGDSGEYRPPRKNWKQILEERYGKNTLEPNVETRATSDEEAGNQRIKARGAGRRGKGKERKMKGEVEDRNQRNRNSNSNDECLEYTYFMVKGKRIGLCSKKE